MYRTPIVTTTALSLFYCLDGTKIVPAVKIHYNSHHCIPAITATVTIKFTFSSEYSSASTSVVATTINPSFAKISWFVVTWSHSARLEYLVFITRWESVTTLLSKTTGFIYCSVLVCVLTFFSSTILFVSTRETTLVSLYQATCPNYWVTLWRQKYTVLATFGSNIGWRLLGPWLTFYCLLVFVLVIILWLSASCNNSGLFLFLNRFFPCIFCRRLYGVSWIVIVFIK